MKASVLLEMHVAKISNLARATFRVTLNAPGSCLSDLLITIFLGGCHNSHFGDEKNESKLS